MSRHRVVVLALMLALLAAAFALDRAGVFRPAAPRPPAPAKPEPPAPPKGVDAATVEAWKRAGFELYPAGYPAGGYAATVVPDSGSDRRIGDTDLAGLPEVHAPLALNLDYTNITDDGLAHLERHKQLASLSLRWANVSDAGLARLAGWKNLRSLDITGTRVTTGGLEKWLPGLTHLTGLQLGTDKLTDGVLAALDASGLLRSLVRRSEETTLQPGTEPWAHLDLREAPVTDEGVKHLAKLTDLTSLDLDLTGVRGPGLKHLKPLTKLTYLKVGFGERVQDKWQYLGITDDLLAGLADARLLHALEWAQGPLAGNKVRRPAREEDVTFLNLYHTRVTDGGLRHLAGLSSLAGIELGGTRVTGTGFRDLTGLKQLTYISLQEAPTTEEGLKAIAGIENLGTLYLLQHPLTPEGVRNLAGLKKLRKLSVAPSRVTDEVLAALVDTGLLRTLTGVGRDGKPNWGVQSYFCDEKDFPGNLGEITYLNLIDTSVTDDGLKPLAKLKNLRQLKLGIHWEHRQVGKPEVTGAGLRHLGELEHLTFLELQGPQITDESMKSVALLKNLKSLDLYFWTEVTFAGLEHLKPLKDTLTEIDLHTGWVEPTEEFKAALKKILPKCKLNKL
jgi:hypothetical protein